MFTEGRIILASRSPRRLDLLRGAGLSVHTFYPEIEETVMRGESPREFTRRLAGKKAEYVLRQNSFKEKVWVIGADTTVIFKERILNKPKDADDAKKMLSLLSGQTHRVMTSFCILGSEGDDHSESVESLVAFRKMAKKEIDWYVASKEPLDKAGAYGAQGLGMIFVDRIEGSYTNVIGFPLCQAISALLKLGAIKF